MTGLYVKCNTGLKWIKNVIQFSSVIAQCLVQLGKGCQQFSLPICYYTISESNGYLKISMYYKHLGEDIFSTILRLWIWDKVFKSGPSKICGRQSLKIFPWSNLEYFVPFVFRPIKFFPDPLISKTQYSFIDTVVIDGGRLSFCYKSNSRAFLILLNLCFITALNRKIQLISKKDSYFIIVRHTNGKCRIYWALAYSKKIFKSVTFYYLLSSPGNWRRHTANADVNAEANCYFTVLHGKIFFHHWQKFNSKDKVDLDIYFYFLTLYIHN